MKGKRTPDGHLLEARVISRLGAVGSPKEPSAPAEERDENSISSRMVEVVQELNCQVPEGSGLVIDSGVLYALRSRSSAPASRTVRKLVAVIPRRILEETEEVAAPGRAEARPAAEEAAD